VRFPKEKIPHPLIKHENIKEKTSSLGSLASLQKKSAQKKQKQTQRADGASAVWSFPELIFG